MQKTKNLLAGIALLAGIFVGSQVNAGTARLTWDANSESDLAGYKVYYDTTSHAGDTTPDNYASTVSVSTSANTGYWMDSLTPGNTYYFQVTAFDTSNNESNCSTSPGEVSKTITYRGDINNTPDHSVDILDFSILAGHYGSTSYCGTLNSNKADINRDCSVDILDFSLLASDFGSSF